VSKQRKPILHARDHVPGDFESAFVRFLRDRGH